MYRAYLKRDDTWLPTACKEDVINHDADVVVFDTYTDDADILEEIHKHEIGRYVAKSPNFNGYLVTDFPCLYSSCDDEIEKAVKEYGKIYLFNQNYFGARKFTHKKRSVYVFVKGKYSDEWPNFIFEPVTVNDRRLHAVTYEPELWELANKKFNKAKKSTDKVTSGMLVGYHDLKRHIYSLQTDGTVLETPLPGHLCVAIMSHDFYVGANVTNKVLSGVAKEWVKYAKENTARFLEKKWATEKELEFLNSRFKKVARIKDEQSTNN